MEKMECYGWKMEIFSGGDYMSRNYKNVKNGKGTDLTIGPGAYISVGKNGEDVTIRGAGKVLAFDKWEDLIAAIDEQKSVYHNEDNPKNRVIGSCITNYEGVVLELKKGFFRQGWIFKDAHAFHCEPKEPCYVPELSNEIYTREDFLRICNGQPEIAGIVFEAVDWQHPETYLDEMYTAGEFADCEECGKIFESYGATKCPHCGASYYKKDYDEE